MNKNKIKRDVILNFCINLVLVILYTFSNLICMFNFFTNQHCFERMAVNITMFVFIFYFFKKIYMYIIRNSNKINILKFGSFSNKNSFIEELKPKKIRKTVWILLVINTFLSIIFSFIVLILYPNNNNIINYLILINNILFIIGLYIIMYIDFKTVYHYVMKLRK